MFTKMLLAVDGSEHALKAAQVAADLAKTMNLKDFRIVTAYEPIPTYLGEPDLQFAIDARLELAQQILDKAIAAIGDMPYKIHTEMIEGSAAQVIMDVAIVRESDMIVIGSRGLGTLAGLLLGSVSQKITTHAPCPVLVVR